MKKNIYYSFIAILSILMGACGSDFYPDEDGNHRTPFKKNIPKIYTVKISLGGDYVSESEEPLLRGDETEVDGDTYVGINVFRTEDGKTSEEKYAYGVFKGKEDINIDMISGYTYRFEATILIERRDHLLINNGYSLPFTVTTERDGGDGGMYPLSEERVFIYTHEISQEKDKPYLSRLSSGRANVNVAGDAPQETYKLSYPRVKRYYGVAPNVNPALNSVEIPMNYVTFGLCINIESIPQGTSLTIRDKTPKDGVRDKNFEELLLFPPNLIFGDVEGGVTNWDGQFSMNKLTAESESFTLEFTWDKGVGGKAEPFTSTFEIHPNMRKILNVNISGTVNSQTKGNITFNIENEPLIDEEEIDINKNFD